MQLNAKPAGVASDYLGYGYFTTRLTGAATFSLNPADFLSSSPYNGFVFDGVDLGFFDSVRADTTITVPGASRTVALPFICDATTPYYSPGEDSCGFAGFKLTYDYTPTTALPAVPEPASWAMMLLGFAGIGCAIRRRKVAWIAAN